MIRLAVRCPPEQADAVLADLTALAPNGVEEDEGDGYVEYAIYGGEGELPELGEIEAMAGTGLVEISSTEIPDDWADRWRDFHQPIEIAGRLRVRPSWERPVDDEASIDIVIDPGRAFGTGAHATTRMSLELLLGLADADERTGALTDLGTGSGVLAIAAAKLGFGPITAYDHEEAAIAAAAANAAANGVELRLERLNLRRGLPTLAPVVVANLTAPLLREIGGALPEPPQDLILSGMLVGELDEVGRAFGLKERRRLTDGDWGALHLAT